MNPSYPDASEQEVHEALHRAAEAANEYARKNLKERARFLEAIASEMESQSESLLQTAARETHLSVPRLQVELRRTLFQLRSYGEACAEGSWLQLRIDLADPARRPPRPDLRKMLVPLGPVVVFGASNFPFAYSTAGGDTACALAAGCPVIVKAHPAHAGTSEAVAEAVRRAARSCGLPAAVFQHIQGAGFETGKALVLHPLTAAVGFTGSLEGGRALFNLAAARPVPIPVFAEMGSVNPVFLFPGKLSSDPEGVAHLLADSITQSVGQFCTNPGLLVGLESPALDRFVQHLGQHIRNTPPELMLHPGIARAFAEKRTKALQTEGVSEIAHSDVPVSPDSGFPTLARVSAGDFLKNPVLHEEVFGPYSLLVVCRDPSDMKAVARSLEGQLTCSVFAREEELEQETGWLDLLRSRCGRLVFNGVPTGVEVALAMHHGGPYPATTDSRFTAVGADGIKRFARPVCFQNCPPSLLPPELQNENPLGLWRTVNDELTRDPT